MDKGGYSKVLVDFNANELSEDAKTWGCEDPSWIKFTGGEAGGNGRIPCLSMDGKLYRESGEIIKILFEKFESDASEASIWRQTLEHLTLTLTLTLLGGDI